MLGTYRFILALLVLFSHIYGVTVIGWYAVHGFFILSGFLMTLVLQQSYGYSFSGLWRYILNRVLRLYPLYWAICIMALFLIFLAGSERSQAFNSQMIMPRDAGEWLSNLSLIYPSLFPAEVPVQISPPSFTLTIEILFYALMALGLSRTKSLCWIWFGISVVYCVVTHTLNLSVLWRYSMLAAGSLPFSIGALLYHYRGTLTRYRRGLASLSFRVWLIIFMALNGLFAMAATGDLEGPLFSVTFYINLGLNGLVILHLLTRQDRINEHTIPKTEIRRDKILGELSYPIYLLHMPIAMALSVAVLNRGPVMLDGASSLLFIATLFISLAVSLALVFLIDRPIQKLRAKVRPHGRLNT